MHKSSSPLAENARLPAGGPALLRVSASYSPAGGWSRQKPKCLTPVWAPGVMGELPPKRHPGEHK